MTDNRVRELSERLARVEEKVEWQRGRIRSLETEATHREALFSRMVRMLGLLAEVASAGRCPPLDLLAVVEEIEASEHAEFVRADEQWQRILPLLRTPPTALKGAT